MAAVNLDELKRLLQKVMRPGDEWQYGCSGLCGIVAYDQDDVRCQIPIADADESNHYGKSDAADLAIAAVNALPSLIASAGELNVLKKIQLGQPPHTFNEIVDFLQVIPAGRQLLKSLDEHDALRAEAAKSWHKAHNFEEMARKFASKVAVAQLDLFAERWRNIWSFVGEAVYVAKMIEAARPFIKPQSRNCPESCDCVEADLRRMITAFDEKNVIKST